MTYQGMVPMSRDWEHCGQAGIFTKAWVAGLTPILQKVMELVNTC